MNKNTSGPKDFARILAQEEEFNKEQHPVEGVVTLDQAFPPERIWQSSSYYDNPIHDEEDREEVSYSEDSNSSLRKSKHNKGLASKVSFGAISQILKLKSKKKWRIQVNHEYSFNIYCEQKWTIIETLYY